MLFLTQRAPGHSPIGPSLHLDLVEANRRQLLRCRPQAAAQFRSVGGCTSCQPELFFSHRASHGHAGRMMSVIGIRPMTEASAANLRMRAVRLNREKVANPGCGFVQRRPLLTASSWDSPDRAVPLKV